MKLQEITVPAGGQATIDFPAIPATYKSLVVVLVGRGDTAAPSVQVTMRLNADATASYDTQTQTAVATTTAAVEAIAATSARVGSLAAASAPSGAGGEIEIVIPDYTVTAVRRRFQSSGSYGTADATGGQTLETDRGQWRNTVAVTEVTLLAATGNFAAGTVATLYGVDSTAGGGGTPLTATTWAAQKPASDGGAATGSYEIGQRFYVDGACHCIGVTFYKPSTETGATHTVHLWDDTSALLGTATTTSETASGWQTALFATPLALTGLAYYRATWGTNAARWEQGGGLPISSGPLHITQDCYNATQGAFPNSALSSLDRYVSPIITVP